MTVVPETSERTPSLQKCQREDQTTGSTSNSTGTGRDLLAGSGVGEGYQLRFSERILCHSRSGRGVDEAGGVRGEERVQRGIQATVRDSIAF